MSERVYEVGDWVTIIGQVKELHPNDVDLGVEVFSKTDQYTAFVRRDLCAPTDKPIGREPARGSVALLARSGTLPMAYQRLYDDRWHCGTEDSADLGLYWDALNRLGDVEVIHHA